MPIYEYVCQQCGEPTEKLQKLSEPPLTDCPACGQAGLKRKISAAGFRLSGGGWYETDFKSSDSRRNIAGEQSEKPKSESGKSDSKSGDSGGSGTSESKSSSKKKESKSAASSSS